ncbi:MAG TPA: diguanylate cyclase [Phycisphaerales bacterium]|nr:diguanylate cyclase [Phycisphaerales bacterium]
MSELKIVIAISDAQRGRQMAVLLLDTRWESSVSVVSSVDELIQFARENHIDAIVIEESIALSDAVDLQSRELRDAAPVVILRGPESTITSGEWIRRGAADAAPAEESTNVLFLWERLEATIERSRTARRERRRINRRFRSLRRAADTDPLTGLNNRRYVERLLNSDRWRRDRRSHVACLLLDLDNFKTINDSCGHDAGDRVLKTLGEVLLASASAGETAVRWGGEEFLVLKAASSLAEAWTWAEHLRRQVELCEFDTGDDHLRVTMSAGVAVVPIDELCEGTVCIADRALLLAKERGKNRVCTWPMAVMVELAEQIESEPGLTPEQRIDRYLNAIDGFLGPAQRRCAVHHASIARGIALGIGGAMNRCEDQVLAIAEAVAMQSAGRAAAPESLLARSGPLTADERRFVAENARLGPEIAAALELPRPVVELARGGAAWNHDHPPGRLSSAVSSPDLQILAASDALAAMIEERPYARRRTLDRAVEELERQPGATWDPVVLHAVRSLVHNEKLKAAA